MGLIRKALHVGTVGAVAPNSKKQRVAKQTLAAAQGASPEQVKRAGGRYEHSLASAFRPSVTVPASDQSKSDTPQTAGVAGVRQIEGHDAPDTKYCRMVRVGTIQHVVPVGPDNKALPCWTCGGMHPKGNRGFRFPTTSLRWDLPFNKGWGSAMVVGPRPPLLSQEQRDGSVQADGLNQPPASAISAPGVADRLRQVSELHEAGLLTDGEYAAKRAELIEQL
jgi:hypothetical protein